MSTHKESVKIIATTLARTKTRHELEVLLEGLLTPKESDEIVLRWRLVRSLLQGETQRDIAEDNHISLGKIARGSRLLKYGPQKFRSLIRKFLEEEGEHPVRLKKRRHATPQQ